MNFEAKISNLLTGSHVFLCNDIDSEGNKTFYFSLNNCLFENKVVKPTSTMIRKIHDLAVEEINQYVRFNDSFTCFWLVEFPKSNGES